MLCWTAVVAGGSAFTASNTIPNATVGYGTNTVSGATVNSIKYVHHAAGQQVRFVRCNAAPLHGPNHEVLGAVVFVADGTRQIEARREVDQLRDRLIETVNHELRTPPAAIVGHVELFQELDQDLPANARWSWDTITRGTARLQAVTDSITELANHAATLNDRDLTWSTEHDPVSGTAEWRS